MNVNTSCRSIRLPGVETVRITCAVLLGVMFLCQAKAQVQPSVNLMPWPAKLQMGSGRLVIDSSFSVALAGDKDPLLQRAVDRFLNDLRRQTGIVPPNMKAVIGSGVTATLVIHAASRAKPSPELGDDESYSLEITTSKATLSAPNSLGVLHGLQTFLQLVSATSSGFTVPAVSIHDQPRFPWRGLMLDPGHHFIPFEVLKRNVDGMAAVKMNVLHLHLSEDQGFRMESKKFPKLQELGSEGFYFTQAEMRDLVAYAADRGIRVVPELDVPGHTTSWFLGYPELASGPGPYHLDPQPIPRDPTMNPTQERTYKFLDAFIGEMAELFPDRYYFIGGDEVTGKEWDANPQIQQYMHAHGINTNAALQAYFNKRVQAIVTEHNKIMMGWDEIVNPDLPKNIVIEFWRPKSSLLQAIKLGFPVLYSTGYYLDLNQSAAQHYASDPLPDASANLSPEETKRILGGEACVWTEFISGENMDSLTWPRTAAIAERLWSPQNITDVDSMYRRMNAVNLELDGIGLTHNSNYDFMLSRIAGPADLAELRTLADVVEPVKDYTRYKIQGVVLTTSPLNRLVDSVHPESETARRFALLVNAFLTDPSKSETEAKIRESLRRWLDDGLQLTETQSSPNQSFLLEEVIPLAQDLSALGGAGLEALDYLDRREPAPESWKTQRKALVQEAGKPKAEVILMIVPSIQKLIDAAAGRTSSPVGTTSLNDKPPMSSGR